MKGFTLQSFAKTNPALFDFLAKEKRQIEVEPDPLYQALDRFSASRGGAVRFVMAGAGDGLSGLPVRVFILRDDWRGILVEPEPYLFACLRRNFPVRRFPNLRLVQGALRPSEHGSPLLFAVHPTAIAKQPLPIRREIRQLASLDHDQILKAIGRYGLSSDVIYALEAAPVSTEQLARCFFEDRHFDLLVLDCGGHETALLASMDFECMRPGGILFHAREIEGLESPLSLKLIRANYALRRIEDYVFAQQI